MSEVTSERDTRRLGSKITDEMLESMRARIGVPRPAHRPWHTAATYDAINHFAGGIGDDNPLWIDREYARAARFEAVIAPPTFVYSCGVTFGGGMPGIHGLFGGTEFTFRRPIREGTPINTTIQLEDLVEMEGRYAGRMYKQIERMIYRDGDGTVLTEAVNWIFRTERDVARERVSSREGRYSDRPIASYTAEELAAIDRDYRSEQRRGPEPRYWDDVVPGKALPPLVKGPLRATDIIAYVMGGGSPYIRAHRVNASFRTKHPSAYIPDALGIPDVPERVHWDSGFARDIGMPAAFDYGHERPSWLAQMLTDWMGDAGWLASMRIELRGVNVVGDLTRCTGRVVDKGLDGGVPVVRCEVQAENQLGEVTARGTATVELPRRAPAA